MAAAYTTPFDETLSELTLPRLLENRAAELGEETFIRYSPDSRQVSFAELNRTANAVGNALRDLGIEPDDPIAVMVDRALPTVFSMVGTQKAGALFAPINTEHEGQPLVHQINDAAADVAIVGETQVEQFEAVADRVETVPKLVVVPEVDDGTVDASGPHSSFQELLDGEPDAPPVERDWSDPSILIYTAGTTDKPRGVPISHRHLVGNTSRSGLLLYDRDDVLHNSIPLHHIAGVSEVVRVLLTGAELALWDGFDPAEFWDRIDRYGATSTMLFPPMINWLLDAEPQEDDAHNTLRKSISSITPDYLELAKRFGIELIETEFTQTETGPIATSLVHTAASGAKTPSEFQTGKSTAEVLQTAESMDVPVVDEIPQPEPEYTYVGVPRTDDFTVRLLDTTGEQLPPESVGEIAVRPETPAVMMPHYYENAEATLGVWENLWHHTRDAGYVDADGNLYFIGRLHGIIRRRGENISPGQIEAVVNDHERVNDAAALPVAGESGEDDIALAVRRTEGATLDEAQLQAHIENALPSYMQPTYVEFMEELPSPPESHEEKETLRDRFA